MSQKNVWHFHQENSTSYWKICNNLLCYNLLSVHCVPIQPGGHLHTPSLRRHFPPFRHLQCWLQFTPNVPVGHACEHDGPVHPGKHWHCPVIQKLNYINCFSNHMLNVPIIDNNQKYTIGDGGFQDLYNIENVKICWKTWHKYYAEVQ